MPELPEVETMRRGILGIVGARIAAVERPHCRQKPILIRPRFDALRRRISGRAIHDIGRIGKRVVLWFDSRDALVFEPRMTGLVLLADPPSREHLRLRLVLQGSGHELLYWDRRGLGTVRLFANEEFAVELGPRKLGPDALEVDAKLYRRQLGHSRRAIKVALLDQRAIAGIGNLYASEILHAAGIHPAVRCDRLTGRLWQKLSDATSQVLVAAIRYEGSTLGDGTYRNALNEAGRYQNEHRVYAKAGQRCFTCKRGKIERIIQAQRSTYFCPICQRHSVSRRNE
jgi:formamidopyrimidine-DNA glycosylase